MKTNRSAKEAHARAVLEAPRTYGGGFGVKESADKAQLLRQVSTCLLWEDTFYEKGSTIADEIAATCAKATPEDIAAVAVMARSQMNLRHVPLFLLSQLDKRRAESEGLVARTLPQVIQRADELSEFLAVHAKVNGWKPNEIKKHLSAQVKKGLARAFQRFNAYQLAKYNRDSAIRLRDVLFLCHPKPKDTEQKEAWAKLASKTLESPDTWEVALSAGADKGATFTRLLREGQLGDMALLRNLRNMVQAKVDRSVIKAELGRREFERILPFRFIAAAKHAPELEAELDAAMVRGMSQMDRLLGRTLLVVDISGSMGGALSGKSELRRVEAACALAILFREVADDVTIYATAGNDYSQTHATGLVPSRHGKALADAIVALNAKLGGGGIFLTQVMDYIAKHEDRPFDRVVVVTDEQDCDHNSERSPARAKKLGGRNYIMNVAPYSVGLAVKDGWTRINGFSERVVDWIRYEESANALQ